MLGEEHHHLSVFARRIDDDEKEITELFDVAENVKGANLSINPLTY